MIDLVWLAAASNLLFASLLAIAAVAIGRFEGYARVAHVMWVLVLVKLVTPPLVSVAPTSAQASVAPIERIGTPDGSSMTEVDWRSESNRSVATLAPRISATSTHPTAPSERTTAAGSEAPPVRWITIYEVWQRVRYPATLAWGIGSLLILIHSVIHCLQFGRLLRATRVESPASLLQLTAELSQRLGLTRPPHLLVTTAKLSPMILPTLPRTTLIVPRALVLGLTTQELRLILAHELTHQRRGDHYIRLLEWLSWLLLWWNPLVGFAQRQLRECEEHSCDLYVLTKLEARARSYAAAILRAVEAITPPATRPPVMASAINSGGTLERRMRKMLSTKMHNTPNWWTRLAMVAIATIVLPLGIVSAADYEKVYQRLKKSVEKGHLTEKQADLMMIALKESEAGHEAENDEEYEFDGDFEEIGEKLKLLVAQGKLSEEEAWEKWKHLKREQEEMEHEEEEWEDDDDEEEERELRGIARRLKMAVQEDRMTEQEAREYWVEILEDRELRENYDDDEWDEADEEEEEDILELERKFEDDEAREDYEHARHELDGFELRLRLAVHEGEISEEEAHERWEDALEEFEHRENDGHDHEEWDEEAEEEREEAFEELREQLIWAIRSGRVSPERLEEEWDDILEEAEEDEDDDEDDEKEDEDDHDDDED